MRKDDKQSKAKQSKQADFAWSALPFAGATRCAELVSWGLTQKGTDRRAQAVWNLGGNEQSRSLIGGLWQGGVKGGVSKEEQGS